MRKEPPAPKRDFLTKKLTADLVVVGGGLAGTCGAITAARAGIKVVLIQDRPVLGGNASSEVRLWALGATSHMSSNNRWAREGGVINEILVENTWRNPEGNAVLFDTVLLDKVVREPNITLLLNTAAVEVRKSDPDTIAGIRAFCSQNSTVYDVSAPLFCDASGDGVVGFLAGAAFRMGAETEAEFGEKFAPSKDYGELLGHSIYFYSKDVGKPVRFVPPSYALENITTEIPRYKSFNAKDYGCRLWWIEWGGRLDTVHETESIKWELWKVVYGVWNYIKNSGRFPEAETLTLEWVGLIPGKRESRRFEGPYILRQQDIVDQRHFDDAVSFGGWSIDLHPADGIFSEKPGCDQWHARGIYQIPYRCLYSRNIKNLFHAGRGISTSHVAFGSTRVMLTCASSAQAVGMAAAICAREKLLPADLTEPAHTKRLQRDLMRVGQHIPGFRLEDPDDFARQAKLTATSRLRLAVLPADGPLVQLTASWAQMLPLPAGRMPKLGFLLHTKARTRLQIELRTSDRPDNHTPDVTLATKEIALEPGQNQRVEVDFGVSLNRPQYVFVCLMKNAQVSVHASNLRVTGLLSVQYRKTQKPPSDIGVETYEFWCPTRRPGGHNIAVTIDPPIDLFGVDNLTNGLTRPTHAPNAWVADPDDLRPMVTLQWDQPQTLARLELTCDTDWDHPMESVLMGHPESAMPFAIRRCFILNETGKVVAGFQNNPQARHEMVFDPPLTTSRLQIQLQGTFGNAPEALFEVRCYAKPRLT